MTAQLLAGAPVAEAVLADVRTRVAALARKGITPGLGTILVGDDGASAGYIRMKQEKALAPSSPTRMVPSPGVKPRSTNVLMRGARFANVASATGPPGMRIALNAGSGVRR